MRPSAAQLLQHERLEIIFNVAEMEKKCALPTSRLWYRSLK